MNDVAEPAPAETPSPPAPEAPPASVTAEPAPEAPAPAPDVPVMPIAPAVEKPGIPTAFTGTIELTLPHLFRVDPKDGSIAGDTIRISVIITRAGRQSVVLDDHISGKTQAPYKRTYSYRLPEGDNGV